MAALLHRPFLLLSSFISLVIHKHTLCVLAIAEFTYLFVKQPWRMTGNLGLIFIWSAVIQCLIGLVLVLVQEIAKYRARQGRVEAGRLLLIPVFETFIWIMTVLTMAQTCIMNSESPNYPHFVEATYSGEKVTSFDIAQFFMYSFSYDMLTWSVYFLFCEHSLCRNSLVRASTRSALASAVCALIELMGILGMNKVQRNVWELLLGFWLSRGIAACAWSYLLFKTIFRSSRRSAIPIAIVCCSVPVFEILVAAVIMLQGPSTTMLESPMMIASTIVYRTMYNLCLYWTLWLDTNYWRGVTRIPIWCAGSEYSPYEQVSDSVIERDMPLLIDRPTIAFIDFAFLKFGAMIGTGATCRVYKGHVCIGPLKGKEVAIKVFTPLELSSDTLAEFANEIHKYERLQHPRVMRLLGVCVCPPDVCMVCELCEGGSLYHVIHNTELSVQRKFELSKQVCEAVAFIHSLTPPLIHRDLKSLNFLVTRSGTAKLSDFGTAKDCFSVEPANNIGNKIKHIKGSNRNSDGGGGGGASGVRGYSTFGVGRGSVVSPATSSSSSWSAVDNTTITTITAITTSSSSSTSTSAQTNTTRPRAMTKMVGNAQNIC